MTIPNPTPADRRAAMAYARALTGTTEAVATWQVFDDSPAKDWRRARILHGGLRDVGADLLRENASGCGIFCTVNGTDMQGRKTANILRIRALFVDCDEVYPEQWHLPPSILVQSVAGPHAYWLVDNCPLDQFRTAQQRLIRHYSSDPKVHDLPRVLRVPGFFHCKGEPRMVDLVSAPAHHYTLAQIMEGIALLPAAPSRPAYTPRPDQNQRGWRAVDALGVFRDAGLYGRDLGHGKHAVVCPWLAEHSHGDPTGKAGDTILWETSRNGCAVFHCAHTHCADKYLAHALEALGVDWRCSA